MKHIAAMALCLLCALCAAAQGDTVLATRAAQAARKHVSVYGFVRNYFNYDSRNTYTSIGGEYNMIPYDQNLQQAEGRDVVDVNAVSKAQFQALTTRVGLNISGPAILGAASSGKIEADFGGFGTNNSVLRIRQAWMKLNWKNENFSHELLAGQTWHPLSGDIMPEVLGMAAGAPFRCHSRTPQLHYTFSAGHLGITAAALYQLQYMYNGPSYSAGKWTSTNSITFANNAIVPEGFLGLNFKCGRVYAQIGSSVQPVRPRNFAYDAAGMAFAVDEMFASFTPTLYAQYSGEFFSVKFRTMLAQNTSHVNQLNGYGVVDVLDDGSWEYAPIKAAISYVDFAMGMKYRANLFFGYMKNLGAGKDLYNFGTETAARYLVFMKGGDSFTGLNDVVRIAPSVSYNIAAFNFGLEYEWTSCTYGDQAANGSILSNDKLHRVSNHRVCALVKYNF